MAALTANDVLDGSTCDLSWTSNATNPSWTGILLAGVGQYEPLGHGDDEEFEPAGHSVPRGHLRHFLDPRLAVSRYLAGGHA